MQNGHVTIFYVMSYLVIYFLLWITFVPKQECAVIRLDHSKRMKDGLEYVMQKYLSPLRKLTADLPNHVIEMQIEIHDSINPPVPTQTPHRRLIRVINSRHPKPIKRTNNATTTEEPEVTTTPASTDASGSLAAAAENTSAGAGDGSKLPVYMDDLKKAMDELEKRLIASQGNPTTMPTSDAQNSAGSQNSQPVRSIDDIVQMLKKAIHVEPHIPRPTDDNLEWVQIKIPKNS